MSKFRLIALGAMILIMTLSFGRAVRAADEGMSEGEKKPAMHMEKKHAPGMKDEGRHAQGKTMTITGEVLDLACYSIEAAHGKDHQTCATNCLKEGSPLGLLTAEGRVYLVVNHGGDEAVKTLRGMAAEQAKVSGEVYHRGGLTGINVKSVEPAAGVKSSDAKTTATTESKDAKENMGMKHMMKGMKKDMKNMMEEK